MSYWFTTIFCEGKFYPMFSLLFGAGLAIMYQSSVRLGRRFGWMFLRRLVVLGMFGLAHVILLWPGDILLIYAVLGLSMLLLGPRSPKTLLLTGGGLFAFGVAAAFLVATLAAIVTSLQNGEASTDSTTVFAASPSTDREVLESEATIPEETSEDATENERARDDEALDEVIATDEHTELDSVANPLGVYSNVFDSLSRGDDAEFGVRIAEADKRVMTQGPFWAAAVVRLVYYSFSFFCALFIASWVIVGCFCLGAALVKLGFFQGQMQDWRRRFIGWGFGIGLPLNIGVAMLIQFPEPPISYFAIPGNMLGGPLLMLAYISLILNWAESGRMNGLARLFGRVGKMALTCYLLESLLMSAIMLHWGFAKFGDNTWTERTVWLLGIYLLIFGFANVWIMFFRKGPLEWIWRAATHLGKPRLEL